jgi:MFS family permease
VLLALPGIAVAAVARLILREPRRGYATVARAAPVQPSDAPDLFTVLKVVWHNRAFRHMWAAISILAFFADGLQGWLPSFLARSFHLDTEQIGWRLALLYGVGGMLGFYWGGALSTRYAARNERLQLQLTAAMYVANAAVTAITLLTTQLWFAMTLNALLIVAGTMISGPVLATIQTLSPSRMRATAMMLMYLLSNLIGLGLGPLAVGALSEALKPILGEESLRYALLAMCPGYFAATWFMWRASLTVSKDLEAVAVLEAQAA